jgi:hypothetical protein
LLSNRGFFLSPLPPFPLLDENFRPLKHSTQFPAKGVEEKSDPDKAIKQPFGGGETEGRKGELSEKNHGYGSQTKRRYKKIIGCLSPLRGLPCIY